MDTQHGHISFAGKESPHLPWWKMRNVRTLYVFIIMLILTNTANGFDGSMMNGLLSLWPIRCTLTSRSVGSKDRQKIGCILMLLAAAGLQSWACTFAMFLSARMILGLGDSIVLKSAPWVITEIAHPQDRAIIVTLSQSWHHSGAFIAMWVTYGTLQIKAVITLFPKQSDWSWRLPSLLQAICTMFILVSIW
ncbi:hypothetical protein jhhlp_008551 [Lomentospora prolificans]|uniref:Major facilitator superfamily (MFS) profile domain-containing protein n=1 Tax=Lomentospora prolificans TaxID=41688 RepID=A0A2N3MYC9_9PEZI|nr:hypothetical protein jhhlp_008551 [Lomentospora prolificans]